MNIEKLFTGVGIVIDDMLEDAEVNDKIRDIVSAIEMKHLPLVKYKELPKPEAIRNFRDASFILLDWQLYRTLYFEDGKLESIKVSDATISTNNKQNTAFVAELLKETSIPIFIFSNKDDVRDNLIANGITEEQLNREPVFIKKKKDLFTDEGEFTLFSQLEQWVSNHSAIYVLKEWGLAFNEAREGLMNDFSNGSQHWPKVIWESATADSVDESDEVSSLLIQNISSRMTPVSFDSNVITSDNSVLSKDELLKVLQAQRYMSVDAEAMAVVGDVYVYEPDTVNEQGIHTNPDNKEIAINIRPTCDCVFRDDPVKNVYLLYGKKLSDGAQKEKFNVKYHKFEELDVEAIVGPIVDGSYYSFRFKDLDIVGFESIKNIRKGRVLEPFVSHITERYSLYIQRHALPSTPEDAVCLREAKEKPKDIQIRTLQEENRELKGIVDNLKANNVVIEQIKKCIRIKIKGNCKQHKKHKKF